MRFNTWAEFLEHQQRQPYMRQISEMVQHDRSLHGFFGSRPFSRANLALTLNNPGCTPVDWRLS